MFNTIIEIDDVEYSLVLDAKFEPEIEETTFETVELETLSNDGIICQRLFMSDFTDDELVVIEEDYQQWCSDQQ